jgi:predicted metalloendopeptidase
LKGVAVAAAFAVLGSRLTAAPAPLISAADRSYMDLSAAPCQDFYAYANGAYDKVPIPAEYSLYGVNQEINERNYAILKDILETSAGEGAPKGTVSQRVGDFYASGMDEAAIENAGLKPLQPLLDAVDAVRGPGDLPAVLGLLQGEQVEAAFYIGFQQDDKDSASMITLLWQGGLGLPERDYYLRAGKEDEALRAAYVVHIERMLALSGLAPLASKDGAKAIMAFETKLATASRPLADIQDPNSNYHKLSRADLSKLAPHTGWEAFFGSIELPASEKSVLVGQPEFLAALDDLMASEPIETWRLYLRWHVLKAHANVLSRAFVEEAFDFYGRKLAGETEMRPRWKRVMSTVDSEIGEYLGQLYVRRAFSAAAKARVKEMVHYHVEALRGLIRAAAWMSDGTKTEAYRKLDAIKNKIGYPDRWRDYSSLEIVRDSYAANYLAANRFEFRRQLAKLGKPVDHDEWDMTPQTNDAYYSRQLNQIVLPAGILQPPFFDERASDVDNYGALASTIGHELTHGFDDGGRKYDWQGNLKNWWTEGDAKAYVTRADFIVRQYGAYEVLPGLKINGAQTLDENIADVGGLRLSYEAYHLATAGKPQLAQDGFTAEQRFFIAFAQGWRTNARPEQLRLTVASDWHSPARWRVIGPVTNFPEFRKAFGCTGPAESWPPIW